MTDQARVQQCLEAVCASGCEAVRATIGALERGQAVSATEGLDATERSLVLAELKAVMAVYDLRGRRG